MTFVDKGTHNLTLPRQPHRSKLRGIKPQEIKKGLTTFGLKTKLYIKAQKEAFKAWQQMQALTA